MPDPGMKKVELGSGQAAPVSPVATPVQRTGPIELNEFRKAWVGSPTPRRSIGDDVLRLGDRVYTLPQGLAGKLPVALDVPSAPVNPYSLDQGQSAAVVRRVRETLRFTNDAQVPKKEALEALGACAATNTVAKALGRGPEAYGSMSSMTKGFTEVTRLHKDIEALKSLIDGIPGAVAKQGYTGVKAQEKQQAMLESLADTARRRVEGLDANGAAHSLGMFAQTHQIGLAGVPQGPVKVDKELLMAYLDGAQASATMPGSGDFVSAVGILDAAQKGRKMIHFNAGRFDAHHQDVVLACGAVKARLDKKLGSDADYGIALISAYAPELEVMSRTFLPNKHPRMENMVNGMKMAAYRSGGNPHESMEAKLVGQAAVTGYVPVQTREDASLTASQESVEEAQAVLSDYSHATLGYLRAVAHGGDADTVNETRSVMVQQFLDLPEPMQELLAHPDVESDPKAVIERAESYLNFVEHQHKRDLYQAMRPEPGFLTPGTANSRTILLREGSGENVIIQASQDNKNVRVFTMRDGEPVSLYSGPMAGSPVKQEAKDWLAVRFGNEAADSSRTLSTVGKEMGRLNVFRLTALAAHRQGIVSMDPLPTKPNLEQREAEAFMRMVEHEPMLPRVHEGSSTLVTI